MASLFGFNPSTARVSALLIGAVEPLSLTEVAERRREFDPVVASALAALADLAKEASPEEAARIGEIQEYVTTVDRAPHLVNGFVSRRGEFRLEPLPGGRTRLQGSTWYQLDMEPQRYWSLYADLLIHAIHARVLDHVKRLSEEDAGSALGARSGS